MYYVEIHFGAPDYTIERIIKIKEKLNRPPVSVTYKTHTGQYFKSIIVPWKSIMDTGITDTGIQKPD